MQAQYQQLCHEAENLVGAADDLKRRAIVYHHLYKDSYGNHVFPLLAAHGVLWGDKYMRYGEWLGNISAYKYVFCKGGREKKVQALQSFLHAFREINRQVCVGAYATYYLTKQYPNEPDVQQFISSEMAQYLNRCHEAAQEKNSFEIEEKKALYSSFFHWEQKAIVGSDVLSAEREFEWACMKFFSLRPIVNFSYFPFYRKLAFCNFINAEERVQNGMKAFDIANKVGWGRVEEGLRAYRLLDKKYDYHSSFQALRTI